MRCMCCTHFEIFHGPHGCTAGESSSNPCKCPGYEAPLGEGREAPKCKHPAWSQHDDGSATCRKCGVVVPPASDFDPAPDAATVEACARAAYEASLTAPKIGAHGQAIMDPEWSALGETHRGYWREVSRAVLAAAKGAGG